MQLCHLSWSWELAVYRVISEFVPTNIVFVIKKNEFPKVNLIETVTVGFYFTCTALLVPHSLPLISPPIPVSPTVVVCYKIFCFFSLEPPVRNPCYTHPCKNHGVCYVNAQAPSGYTCDCTARYDGDNCEIDTGT